MGRAGPPNAADERQRGGRVRWLRARLGMVAGERGSALVEFTFIAIVVFVPLVYIVAGFSAVQRGVFASTAAAREAGRAMGTAPDPVTGAARAEAAADRKSGVEGKRVDPGGRRIITTLFLEW